MIYVMSAAWLVATVCLIVTQRQLAQLRERLDPDRIVHQLNRGALILPTDRPGPPREYTVHIERRAQVDELTPGTVVGADEFWIWS